MQTRDTHGHSIPTDTHCANVRARNRRALTVNVTKLPKLRAADAHDAMVGLDVRTVKLGDDPIGQRAFDEFRTRWKIQFVQLIRLNASWIVVVLPLALLISLHVS